MKSRAYQTTPTPVLDLLPSLLTTKTNRPPHPDGVESLRSLGKLGFWGDMPHGRGRAWPTGCVKSRPFGARWISTCRAD